MSSTNMFCAGSVIFVLTMFFCLTYVGSKVEKAKDELRFLNKQLLLGDLEIKSENVVINITTPGFQFPTGDKPQNIMGGMCESCGEDEEPVSVTDDGVILCHKCLKELEDTNGETSKT